MVQYQLSLCGKHEKLISNMKRIHIPNMGPDQSTIPKAIAIGIRECKSLNRDQLTLITPVKDNLDSIVVGEFLGKEASKKLMKGGLIPLPGHDVSIGHESVASVQKRRTPSVGLVFYVSSDAIQKLDGLNFDCLIFVPWLDQDGIDWGNKWDAETIGASNQKAEVDLPVEVIEALGKLTACVNLSTGLGHPSDKDQAKRIFSALRANGIRWAPSEIEKWAVRNSWRVSDAAELANLSTRYVP